MRKIKPVQLAFGCSIIVIFTNLLHRRPQMSLHLIMACHPKYPNRKDCIWGLQWLQYHQDGAVEIKLQYRRADCTVTLLLRCCLDDIVGTAFRGCADSVNCFEVNDLVTYHTRYRYDQHKQHLTLNINVYERHYSVTTQYTSNEILVPNTHNFSTRLPLRSSNHV